MEDNVDNSGLGSEGAEGNDEVEEEEARVDEEEDDDADMRDDINEEGDDEDDEDDDEHYSSEEEEDDDDEDDDIELEGGDIIHEDVNCDECGASPIHGIRYHSTRIIDYDICEDCYNCNHQNMHLAGAFVAITKPQIIDEDQWFTNPESLSVDAFGWDDLIHELKANPNVQSMDIGLHSEENGYSDDDSDIDDEDVDTVNNLELVSKTLRKSKTLKSLYVTSNYLEDYSRNEYRQHSQMISSLTKGLSYNTSLITLSVTLDFSILGAMDAICELITPKRWHGTKKNNIRYLLLEHNPDRSLSAYNTSTRLERLAGNSNNDENNYRLQFQHNNARTNAIKLFQALADDSCSSSNATKSKSLLNSFVISAYTLVGNEQCRKYALQALKTRPNLIHIKTFHPLIDNDPEISTIMQDKKHQQINWMNDWNDPNTTRLQHYHILQQILDSPTQNPVVTSTPADQIAALYHFIRSNPRAIVPDANSKIMMSPPPPKQQQQTNTDSKNTGIRTTEKKQQVERDDDDNSSSGSNKRIRLEGKQ